MNMNMNLFFALVALFASTTTAAAASTPRRYSYQQRAPLAYADLDSISSPLNTPRKNHLSPPTLLNDQERNEHEETLQQRRHLLEQYQSQKYVPRQEKLEKISHKAKTITLVGASSGKTFNFSNRSPTFKKNKTPPTPAPLANTESPIIAKNEVTENATSSSSSSSTTKRSFSGITASASKRFVSDISI
mmetsp:Transcript_20342/g.44038  ORF Transcript_20342/g.44038 Transcript_20342/m.44038 type:complete len:189 (+) Transcript_20342:100-666(+)|eukprot:CAMPEP_0168733016 /NCGR_PEP_ID=MMETSP0724-20121128/8067_1 /TAXON_ID=265536 /ORGANISM="Amphiprora sp., Strain CCMP467" /LENGTH=188 /DNA_ID=CAMNT_0008780049 /DNA_START=78 /DNA_END=644 /DNA_ORIENTATION=+